MGSSRNSEDYDMMKFVNVQRAGGIVLVAALVGGFALPGSPETPTPGSNSTHATIVSQADAAAAETPTLLEPDDGSVTADQVQTLVADGHLKVEEVTTVFEGKDLDLTVGVNATSAGALDDLDGAVVGTLTDMSNLNKGMTYDPDLQSTLEEAATVASDGVEFSQVILSEAPAVVPEGMTVVEKDNSDLALASDSDCGKTWWPNWVKGSAGASSVAGMRYGQTNFEWTTNSRLTALKCYDDVTFEPDFTTYNYDDLHYFHNSIEAWSTTMPSGYKDTKFMDGGNELTFTVGTSDARKLQPDKEYKTYFRTKKGNSSTDKAKVFLQRGNRTPSVCHSTWCIFAKATNQYVPAWQLSMPGNVTVFK